jgi:hypothetical protein
VDKITPNDYLKVRDPQVYLRRVITISMTDLIYAYVGDLISFAQWAALSRIYGH